MAEKTNAVVILETSKGDITIELWADKAPISAENFLGYVKSGYYAGTVFHRVIKGFMVQGGGMDEKMAAKPGAGKPIRNEAGNGATNDRGTLAMARTNVVDSATAQFFINLVDNDFLNHKDETPRGFGYAVFGRVTAGMDIVDAIAAVATATKFGHDDVPTQAITIRSARVA
jgi:cyclophilin family peptidyl-prolyl cis-trans isomerase